MLLVASGGGRTAVGMVVVVIVARVSTTSVGVPVIGGMFAAGRKVQVDRFLLSRATFGR